MSSPQRSLRPLVSRRMARVSALAAALVAAPLMLVSKPLGLLINHFNIGYDLAALAISLIVSGSWEFAIIFPYLIPVEITIQTVIAVFGAGYAIGW